MTEEDLDPARTPVDDVRDTGPKARAVIEAARTVVAVMAAYEHEPLPTPLVSALIELRRRLDEL